VTIDGLAIVKPTIGPLPTPPQAEQSAAEPVTPEGLEPLRPLPPTRATGIAPEVVIEDINEGAPEAPRERIGTAPAATAPDAPGRAREPSPTPGASAPAAAAPSAPSDKPAPGQAVPEEAAAEPKVDRRRKAEEPALFDLETQAPPVKPGTPRAEHSEWEELITRIADERIPVQVRQLKGGNLGYSVASLSKDEQALLTANRFAHRTNGRLAGIHDRQQREIQRLARWISTHGKDPSKLIIKGRTARLGDAPSAVQTLMKHWGPHPDVLQVIRNENTRRIDMAKEAARAPMVVEQDNPYGLTREQMLEEAAAVYPAPDQVYTREVSEFTRLLRELAPKDQLQKAANRIHASVDAREDVNRHTVQLATAFSRHVEGVDLREAYLKRGGRDGI